MQQVETLTSQTTMSNHIQSLCWTGTSVWVQRVEFTMQKPFEIMSKRKKVLVLFNAALI